MAHRGAHQGHAENTPEAVQRAAELGAGAVEVDVYWWARSSRLQAGHEQSEDGAPARPLLEAVAASPLLLVLDWKGGGGEAHAAQLLRELGLTARTVVSTGEAAALLRFRSSDPELLTGLTLDGSSGWRLAVSMLLRIREARARAVMLEWHSAHRITVAAARVAGCGVFFWTVNRPEDYRRLLRYRPDGIMSDRFELLPDAGNSVSRGPGGAA